MEKGCGEEGLAEPNGGLILGGSLESESFWCGGHQLQLWN